MRRAPEGRKNGFTEGIDFPDAKRFLTPLRGRRSFWGILKDRLRNPAQSK